MSTPEAAHTPANANAVPVYQAYMNPILAVLRSSGRPLLNEELDERVVEALGLAPEVVAIPHDPARPERSEVSYRLAWARAYLKKAGLLIDPRLGLWALTDEGRRCGDVDARSLVADLVRSFRGENAGRAYDSVELPAENVAPESVAARGWIAHLREAHQELLVGGDLLSREQIEQQLRRFREEFGPEVLARLDGDALLAKMHGRRTRDSLAYRLEFESDAALGSQLGSIGGGTALKFGLYQAAESGAWMTGTSRGLEVLSTEQATACARVQRDQLVQGAELLEVYARDSMRRDFGALQAEMERVAPDLVDVSWAHKYFSLIVPAVIGSVHDLNHQRYLLIKLLRTPGGGRYHNAGLFLEVAAALGVSVCELGATLRRRHGSPHAYWRVGATENGQSEWGRMRDGHFVGVGWAAIGDLTSIEHDRAKDHIHELVQRHYAGQAGAVTSAAHQVFAFVTRAKERDLVLVTDGMTVRGVGRIQGDYFHRPGDGAFPHRRPVEWLSTEEWRLPIVEGPRRMFHLLGKHPANLVQAEARLLRASRSRAVSVRPSRAPEASPLPPLEGRLARIQAILHRKRQAILHGPPGTGKTYWADRVVRELSARSWFGATYDALSPERRVLLEKEGAFELCTFHPGYGYEDFVEGPRPSPRHPDVGAALRDGLFKRLCQRSSKHPKRDYFLVIDEIDRGDTARIFGELVTVLEQDKRGRAVTLPLSGEPLIVPPNVYLVGTMTAANGSLGSLDVALRRRFGFIEMRPDSAVLGNAIVAGLPLGAWLDALNQRIVRHVGRNGRHSQIGHSYLMLDGSVVKDVSRFVEVLRDDIVPLLEECCREDSAALEQILGPALVRRAEPRLDAASVTPVRHGELMEALRAAFPELATAPRAIAAELAAEDERGADDDEEDEPSGEAIDGPVSSAR